MQVYSPSISKYLNWLKFILLALVVPVITYLEYGVKSVRQDHIANYDQYNLDEEILEPAPYAGSSFFKQIQAHLSQNRSNSSYGKSFKFQLDSFVMHESLHFQIDRIFDDFVVQGHHYEPEWILKAQHALLFRQTLF